MPQKKRKPEIVILALAMLILAAGFCRSDERAPGKSENAATKIHLTSPTFADGAAIPSKYTCDGENISPPVAWGKFPEKTKSLALVCDDPDAPAGTWVHWVIFNIPPIFNALSEKAPPEEILPPGTKQGRNDFNRIGYGGPCPPRGNPHRYFFKLYALDTKLSVHPGATKKELMAAIEGHILAQGQLMGTYKRK
jgi:Raf kinase inhibitor-like YbhB/YbcL family protein